MSNERERLAREWAKRIMSTTLEMIDPVQRAAAEHILATTTDQTMAGVEWSDEKHHLAGATTPAGNDVVMMWCDEEETGHIITAVGEWRPDQLTQNGKKYELREAGAGEEPEHLVDVDDFEDAPEGTIVASDGYLSTPLVKRYGKWCRDRIEFTAEELDAVAEQLRVLRWGWGK